MSPIPSAFGSVRSVSVHPISLASLRCFHRADTTASVSLLSVGRLSIMESLHAFNDSFRQYDYASRALLALGLMVGSAYYLHTFIKARLAPGLRALLAVVPLLVLNAWIPMMFDSRTELLTRLVS